MIVRRTDGLIHLVTQSDHAGLAARILSLWLLDGMPSHPRRGELIEATRDHDLGWQGADAAPRLDPDGRPWDAFVMPSSDRLLVWTEAVDRVRSRGWVGALVREHAWRIGRFHEHQEAWRDFRREVRGQQDEFLAAAADATGRPMVELERELSEDTDLLQTADSISLLACGAAGVAAPHHVMVQVDRDEVRVSPFPFAGPTTLALPYREIPDRRYEELSEVVEALARAPWRSRRVRLVPVVT